MAPSRSKNETWSGQYICLNRNSGRSTCKSGSYTIPLAHAAILAEVKRLQGSPWKPQALEHAAEDRESEKLRAKLIRDLERERKRREQNSRLLMRIGDPTDEEIAEFRRTGAEIAANIKAIEVQLATIPTPDISLPDLEALHCNLTHVQLSEIVNIPQADNDAGGLREVVMGLVESAKIVDRLPANKSKWARAEVTWKKDVQMLLDYGLLTLAPPADRPKELTRQEYDALKYQRRKKQLGPYWRKDKAVPQVV